MIKFLAMQIRLGKITLDDVPLKYVEAVIKLLNEFEV